MRPDKLARDAVLVVDNDRGSLVAVEAVLEPLRCPLVLARSGHEAVDLARGEDFAAIVMDVCMPDLDGYAAGSFIRQNPRSMRTPILFVSGEDIDLARLTRLYGSAGQIDFMRKPLEPDVLRAKVAGWLDLFRKDQKVQELELAMDSARAATRAKNEVLAMVAHDLAGPLSTIRINVENLRRKSVGASDVQDLNASVQRHVDLVDRNVNRMSKMVSDLLDAARIDSGTLRLDLARHDLGDAVEQAIELLRPLAEQKDIVLAVSKPSTGCVITCDRDRVLQVLSNLVGNALKFAPRSAKVDIELTRDSGELVVCVRDTGPGIPLEQLPLVFEQYWQAGCNGGRQGVGLGLAIARAIVLAHQGRIWVESQRGEGSRFFFSLPSAIAQPAGPEPAAGPESAAAL